MSRSSIALSNMRAVVIVIVLAFHSALAYLAALPDQPYRFNAAPYLWQAIPIVDHERWFGFDLFCAWQDVSLMALMFFLSGLFVPSSLARKGAWTYFADRLLRIGLPFALAVLLLMPVAYYPTFRVTALDPSLNAYVQSWLALPFWPCGPQWFLWLLLTLNILAAGLHRFAPGFGDVLGRWAGAARNQPVRFFVGLSAFSALAYMPLALWFAPWDWTHFSPFSFQLSRPLHYLVYFFAGYAIGTTDLDRGLLATDGLLARRWALWTVVSLVGFGLWAGPTSLMLDDDNTAPLFVQIAAALGYSLACAAGCLFLLAVCLRFGRNRVRALDSLSANAYGMYLVHYVFVVWLQFALLDLALFAVVKVAIVFGGTLLMSWAISAGSGGLSFGASLVGAKR
jgi:hypothetical protein